MMKSNARKAAICLAVGILLAATLACNISALEAPAGPTPEVATTVAPATEAGLAEAPTEGSNTEEASVVQTSPTPPSLSDNNSAEGGTPEGISNSGGDPSSLIDIDIFTSVSIKDGNESYEGKISFPGGDTSDDIYVKPIGFDSEKTSGSLTFTLTCSGRGKAKVNYKGGKVESGSPGCGETWTVYVINGSPDSQITIRLDASGEVDWALTVTSGK
jgi:hypothetical protein